MFATVLAYDRAVAAHPQLAPAVATEAERLARLNALLEHAAEHSPFQRERVRGHLPLARLADLRALPRTSKQDLVYDPADHPPFGTNLTRPLDRYTHLHQ